MQSSMKTLSLKAAAVLVQGEAIGNLECIVSGIEDLAHAEEIHLSFLGNPLYLQRMNASKAGIIIVSPQVQLVEGKNYIIHKDPSLAFQKIIDFFFSERLQKTSFEGIHPTAVIHPTAKIGKNVVIGPNAIVEGDCVIGDNVHIGALCYIGLNSSIGNDSYLYPHVTVREYIQIGSRVIIQPGAVIGSCGFGFNTDSNGIHTKLEQLGIVVIEDDVEVGANTTIDRARFKKTFIQQGTKIDNLVQISHGVELGQHNLIISQVGVAGSTKTGRNVVLAGQVGVVGHIEISNNVIVTARSGVTKSIPKPGTYGGFPAIPVSEYRVKEAYIRKLKGYVERIALLEKKILEK